MALSALLSAGAQAGVIIQAGGAPDELPGQRQLVPEAPYAPVTVALPDGEPFHYLFLDLDVRDGGSSRGVATFTISLPGKPDVMRTFGLDAGGRNLFTIAADGDDAITKLRIASDLELEKVDLLRIAAVQGSEGGIAPVPEPAAFGLLGLGVAALGLVYRRAKVATAR